MVVFKKKHAKQYWNLAAGESINGSITGSPVTA
jgi:hypothetical protein